MKLMEECGSARLAMPSNVWVFEHRRTSLFTTSGLMVFSDKSLRFRHYRSDNRSARSTRALAAHLKFKPSELLGRLFFC
jgi:hypothetical protein